MLFEFKSKATGNLIMTDAVGRQALDVIGKTATSAGIITVSEMPFALQALKQAVAASKNAGQAATKDEPSEERDEPIVPLASRLLPLIEMIERSHKGGEDIVWGV